MLRTTIFIFPFSLFLFFVWGSKKIAKSSPLENRDGRTYYVAPDGDDNNPGTDSMTPWKSLDKINSIVFTSGDQILLKSGGVWNGNLILKGSGTKDTPIVLDKYGGIQKPIINGKGKFNGSSAVLLDRVSNWVVTNLEITNKASDNLSYALTGLRIEGSAGKTDAQCERIKILNCYIHDVNAATVHQPNYNKNSGGIILHAKLEDVLVSDCHIANCSVEGLRTTGFSEMELRSKGIIFERNLIENIYGDGIVMAQVSGGSKITHNKVRNACMTNDINFAGIWTVGSYNTIVSYNEVCDMKGGGPNDGMAFDADGWDDRSATNGDIFEYNYSHDNNGGFFLFMSHSDNIVVRYNISVNDIGKTGRRKLFLIENSSRKNRKVYNNVFYMNNPVNKLFWKGSGAEFSNNIFFFGSSMAQLSDVIPDERARFYNNCFYPLDIYASMDWGQSLRKDNFNANPHFVHPVTDTGLSSALGFRVSSYSKFYNQGTPIRDNGGKDFWGNRLPKGKPDVGAFQHMGQSGE